MRSRSIFKWIVTKRVGVIFESVLIVKSDIICNFEWRMGDGGCIGLLDLVLCLRRSGKWQEMCRGVFGLMDWRGGHIIRASDLILLNSQSWAGYG